MRPTVAIVAADEPHAAAKMPQPTTLICSRRPGRRFIHGARPSNISSESLVRKRISPIQMKSGSAVRVQLVLLPQIDVAMIGPAGAPVPTTKIASPVAISAMPIHSPLTRKNVSATVEKTARRAKSISVLSRR